MTLQRLQKIIAATGFCSRRHAEELLKQGRVRVNGILGKIGNKADPNLDIITVDGKPLPEGASNTVLILNKPRGVICSCKDPQGRQTVMNLLPDQISNGLYPVGRLDADSRGALLLTNHGDLTLHLTHPRYGHNKTYRVWVNGIPSKKTILTWSNGVILDGEMTQPARVKLLKSNNANSLLQINMREGRNRQIRRVGDLLGHKVIDLQRIEICGITLGNLKEGHWRVLEREEWEPILISQSETTWVC